MQSLFLTVLHRSALPTNFTWAELYGTLKSFYPGKVKFEPVTGENWDLLTGHLMDYRSHALIQYRSDKSRLYQEHCILHEIAHLFLFYLLTAAERSAIQTKDERNEESRMQVAACRSSARGRERTPMEELAEQLAFYLARGIIRGDVQNEFKTFR